MKILRAFARLFIAIKLFFFILIKILVSNKKNIVFLEGGFGIVSSHSYSLEFILPKKRTLVFWLVKDDFNPKEIIYLWKKRVDIIPIDIFKININLLNLNSKKIFILFCKKIIKFLNKNFLDIYDFDIMFYNKNMVPEFEKLERKIKNFKKEGFDFHNEQNMKKYKIFRSPFLSQIINGENSKKPILKYNKLILKDLKFLLKLKKNFYMLFVRKRDVLSLEGRSRNGSGLVSYLDSIIYLNSKGYVPLINGDFSKKDINLLNKKKVEFFDSSKMNLSNILFYQLSVKISKFVISEYGGGTCLPFTMKKKMLLLNFFPISHGYPNSLIFPKIYQKKKGNISNIKKLFEKKAFNEFIKNNEFRKLNSVEIKEATKDFFNNFLFKKKISKNKISNMNCNFSSYLKTSKYSDIYIRYQKKYFINKRFNN